MARPRLRRCLAATVAAAWFTTCASASTLDALLDASGVSPGLDRAAAAESFREDVGPLVDEAGRYRSPYRAARRLHRLLHERVFHKYAADADEIVRVFRTGEFNCVSAALVEGIALEALGIPVRVVEGPRHLFLTARIDEREVEIEATSSRGFDRRWNTAKAKAFLLAYKLATPEELAADPAAAIAAYRGLRPPVDLAAAASFLRFNRALREAERGGSASTARDLSRAVEENPRLLDRADELGVAFARAFRNAYDAGRFDEALEVADRDLSVIPGRVSARDRYLAAAVKRIEALADAGEVGAAESVLLEIRRQRPDLAPALERGVAPLAAAAAARAGDSARARRFAALSEAARLQ